ncbi:hypothetical protein MRX96_037175 [Rhipicephalus microplus]
MVSSNHFLLFVQLLAVISTSSPDCVEPHEPGTPNGTCPPQPEPSRCCPEPLQPPVPVTPYAATKPTASTSSSHPENYKYSQPCTARLSGQWNGAAATMVSSNHFLLFVQVCSGPVSGRYQYDKIYMSALFTNSTHALTFETEQSIKAKLCALKSKFLKLNFGISVYDIDADMEDKSCATVQYRGRYERLKLLKRILDFLKGYTAANMKKECENL